MKKTAPDAVRSRDEFRRQLNTGEVELLYLFDGEERYLRDAALKVLESATIDPPLREYNRTIISAVEQSLEAVLGLARQYPMLSSRRLIIVKDFENISDERQLEMLKSYLADPVSSSIVVFITDGMDNRRNIATMLRKACRIISFEPLDEQQTAKWVVDYAGEAGCTLDLPTATWLVATVGVNLTRLAGEVEKLVNYARDPANPQNQSVQITRQDIDQLVRYTHEHSNFQLTDAIVAGESRRALRLLDLIFANTDESVQSLALMIVGAIASNFRKMLISREMMALNFPNSEIAQAVGMSPYAVTYLNQKARRVDEQRLIQGLELTAQTDLALKTSLATPKMLIEVLVCELARR